MRKNFHNFSVIFAQDDILFFDVGGLVLTGYFEIIQQNMRFKDSLKSSPPYEILFHLL